MNHAIELGFLIHENHDLWRYFGFLKGAFPHGFGDELEGEHVLLEEEYVGLSDVLKDYLGVDRKRWDFFDPFVKRVEMGKLCREARTNSLGFEVRGVLH